MQFRILNYGVSANSPSALKLRPAAKIIDAVLQCAPISVTTTAQPGAPAEGDVYVLPTGKTGAAWASLTTGSIVMFVDGGWLEIPAREGFKCFAQDTKQDWTYQNGAWAQPTPTNLNVGTAATRDIGASGATVPMCNVAVIWELVQRHTVAPIFDDIPGTQLAIGLTNGFRNMLINGSGSINQRAPATNADDTYGHDRWNVLTQSNPVAVSTLTDVEAGMPNMMRITQSNASAQRFGYSQIVKSQNCRHRRANPVAFAARVRCSAATTIRYAVLEWTGTADVVTSDIVADWTNGTFTTGNFFNSTTLTLVAAGSLLLAAATLTTLPVITNSVGASANNLIVFVWTDSTQAQNVTLDIGKAQLEPGAVATQFERVPDEIIKRLCRHYYRKSFLQTTTPAQSAGLGTGEIRTMCYTANAGLEGADVRYDEPMRVSPTVTLYNPVSANAQARDITGSFDSSSAFVAAGTANGFTGAWLGNASSAANSFFGFHYSADAEL